MTDRADDQPAPLTLDLSPAAEALLAPWTGPCGGTPPFDAAEPASIESAYRVAIAHKREEVAAIASNPEPPTFGNTIAALEDAGRALRRVETLFRVFSSTRNTGEMREVETRLKPLLPALEDEIAHDDALFARIRAVDESAEQVGLTPEEMRLTRVVRDRLARRGAGLEPRARARLAEISGRIAELSAAFSQNLLADEEGQAIPLDDEAELEGLGEELRGALAAAAVSRGLPARWAVPNTRTQVMPVLASSARRELRERVWRMWVGRGGNPGAHDNRPVVAEILRLRGEKARLLGFPTYAHLATADRMAGTPENALALVKRVWDGVVGAARDRLGGMQALADEDGVHPIAPWDRRFYANRLRREQLDLDEREVSAYLPVESICQGAFRAAGRLHGLDFEEVHDVAVCHPDVRVFAVRREEDPVGLLWLDLFAHDGKVSGGWMDEYRPAESFRGEVLPLVSINMNVGRPAAGATALLSWWDALTVFHELGHALHMLCSEAHSPSLGSFAVAPDFLELPSILNERWLTTPEVLEGHARHHQTGEPMPKRLVEKIEEARVFDPPEGATARLDYLATAVVDIAVHLGADGGEVDPVAVEERALADLGLPPAAEPLHHVTHLRHAFAGIVEDRYAAGYYCYLWADVLASDVAEAFLSSPGGLYDATTAERYRRTILAVGHGVPAAEAFRSFRGRDPDPEALTTRFGRESERAARSER